MANSFDRLQPQSAFSYIFKDPAWVGKVAIFILVMFSAFIIPVLPYIILAGYGYLIMEKIIVENGEPYLPEWRDFSLLLTKGWKIFAVSLLYYLPAGLIFFAATICMMSPAFILPVMETFDTWPSSIGYSSTSALLPSVNHVFSLLPSNSSDEIFLLVMLIGMALLGIGMVLWIPTRFVSQVAIGHVVAKNKFSSAFKLKEVWDVFRSNWTGYLIVFLIQLGCSMALSILSQVLYFTLILCCLLPIIALAGSTYISLISYPLYAMAYRQAANVLQARKAEPFQEPVDPPESKVPMSKLEAE